MNRTLTTLLALLSFLPAHAEEKTGLLGKDLANWTFMTKEGEKPVESAWKLEDGILSTTGETIGYIRTKEEYKHYTLSFQWRWSSEKEDSNSGLLVHITTHGVAGGLWPKCYEAQLHNGNAGDFWTIGETLEATGENSRARWTRTADPKEKPLGEWNTMTVISAEDSIEVHVNGTLVNKGKNLSTTQGAIGFQSEGFPIEIRNLTLTP
jgi:hypothetical protein